MKLSLLLLVPAALVLAPVEPVLAQRHGTHIEIGDGDDDSPARLGSRHSLAEARHAITTTNNVASLLLTRDAVAMQLTDRALRDIGREIDEDAQDAGVFARMVSNVVRNSVRTMLRRSVEYPVRDIRSVEYSGGRLVFTSEEGERIFEDVEVNGTEVMESFSPADARAFVREFNALKARLR